jgi:hypothetical protein
MQSADAVAAIFVFASLAAMVVGVAHYWYKARVAKLQLQSPVDAEKRLARLEVAIDDMTAELMRVSEGQQTLSRLLADRSSEAHHVAR